MTLQKISASFRDPLNQVFKNENGDILRLIRDPGRPHYEALMQSGLYDILTKENLLVPHQDVSNDYHDTLLKNDSNDIIIKPEKVPFVSYPCEWSFSTLKRAALNTLKIQKLCLDHNMTLQDASAYNIQFLSGHWVLIDTGSFHRQDTPQLWQAYRQFCQHFLAPLTLMAYVDPGISRLLLSYTDGIPLDLASKMLPLRAKLHLPVLMHIIMHGQYAMQDASVDDMKEKTQTTSKNGLYGLIDQLQNFISNLNLKQSKTAWTDYEDTHTYNNDDFQKKESFVLDAVNTIMPKTVWDFGANTGHYSRLIKGKNPEVHVIAFEGDVMTTEIGDRKSRQHKNPPLHLWMDLFNPTPDYGWDQNEWRGLHARGPADLVLCLALVHHICLGGNIPLDRFFLFLSKITRHAIVEFVPKDDPQSRRLLKTKGDIFPAYTRQGFEQALASFFTIERQETITRENRVLYHLTRKTN